MAGKEDVVAEKTASDQEEDNLLSQLLSKHLTVETKDSNKANAGSLDSICKRITSNKCCKIIVMVGAGISTSAGIPDFRSPSCGIYANLNEYNLPYPQAIFEIDYFKENAQPFFKLAKELFPEKLQPTLCHYFLKLLHDKGLLLRLYTQNIDTLETIAGIPSDKIIEAHGSFGNSRCMAPQCNKSYSLQYMKDEIFKDVVPTCSECNSVIKPDIVFFGENLPDRFFKHASNDFKECDLLLVMGTSLTVEPFASLIDMVGDETPRCFINKAKCRRLSMMASCGDSQDTHRDVEWMGLCDDASRLMAQKLGWMDELAKLTENHK